MLSPPRVKREYHAAAPPLSLHATHSYQETPEIVVISSGSEDELETSGARGEAVIKQEPRDESEVEPWQLNISIGDAVTGMDLDGEEEWWKLEETKGNDVGRRGC
jgi:hypothetical protein